MSSLMPESSLAHRKSMGTNRIAQARLNGEDAARIPQSPSLHDTAHHFSPDDVCCSVLDTVDLEAGLHSAVSSPVTETEMGVLDTQYEPTLPPEEGDQGSEEEEEYESRGLLLTFKVLISVEVCSCCLCFKPSPAAQDVDYIVKNQANKRQRIHLLNRVSGTLYPGQMSALVGTTISL